MILIFETHPIQYRAPLYQEMNRLGGVEFCVIYASDCSVRGHVDKQFGEKFSWDVPLLQGYDFKVLNNEKGDPLNGFFSLHGRGVYQLLKDIKPSAILMCSFLYQFDFAALLAARRLGIPVLMRHETQDHAFPQKNPLKVILRTLFYRILYSQVKTAFPIGKLNLEHYRKYGLSTDDNNIVSYSVPDHCQNLSLEEKENLRNSLRAKFNIPVDHYLIGFSGKLIPKKNPDLILEAIKLLPDALRQRTHVLFLGSGELADELKSYAKENSINAIFPGFVNQSELVSYYLAFDTMALPSRQMGETWGLVVNEGLMAGCSVIVSDAVGSSSEFGNWQRVSVIHVGDAEGFAEALTGHAQFDHDFNWATEKMKPYTIPEVAKVYVDKLKPYG